MRKLDACCVYPSWRVRGRDLNCFQLLFSGLGCVSGSRRAAEAGGLRGARRRRLRAEGPPGPAPHFSGLASPSTESRYQLPGRRLARPEGARAPRGSGRTPGAESRADTWEPSPAHSGRNGSPAAAHRSSAAARPRARSAVGLGAEAPGRPRRTSAPRAGPPSRVPHRQALHASFPPGVVIAEGPASPAHRRRSKWPEGKRCTFSGKLKTRGSGWGGETWSGGNVSPPPQKNHTQTRRLRRGGRATGPGGGAGLPAGPRAPRRPPGAPEATAVT